MEAFCCLQVLLLFIRFSRDREILVNSSQNYRSNVCVEKRDLFSRLKSDFDQLFILYEDICCCFCFYFVEGKASERVKVMGKKRKRCNRCVEII